MDSCAGEHEEEVGAANGVGAPGGPLFVPGFISGLIRVTELQHSWLTLLAALESDSGALPGEESETGVDISVEDLRIVTDAHLVDKALAEVLTGPSAQLPADKPENRAVQGEKNGESFTAMLSGGDEAIESGQTLSIVQAKPTLNPADPVMIQVCHEQEDQDVNTGVASTEEGLNSIQALILPEVESSHLKRKSRRKATEGREGGSKIKRGRPCDRNRTLELDLEAIRREEALIKMKQSRVVAKEKANLHALRFKHEREAIDNESKKRLRKLKYFTSIQRFPTRPSSSLEQRITVKPTDVVFVVEFYHSLRKHDKMQELLVLGSQPLTSLRDRLYCLTDELARKGNVHTPSGYFLIEDVFYNDMRDPNAKDYSKDIIRWAHDSQEATEKWNSLGASDSRTNPRATLPAIHSDRDRVPDFSAVNMAETCFLDLQFRVGAQYLYCHQGDCKHRIVIRDMRLVHVKDVQDVEAYPVLRWHARPRHMKCSICNIYRARKVTYGDKLASSSPCFFCEQCYYLLHYKKEGCLLYHDFKVYDYYQE